MVRHVFAAAMQLKSVPWPFAWIHWSLQNSTRSAASRPQRSPWKEPRFDDVAPGGQDRAASIAPWRCSTISRCPRPGAPWGGRWASRQRRSWSLALAARKVHGVDVEAAADSPVTLQCAKTGDLVSLTSAARGWNAATLGQVVRQAS